MYFIYKFYDIENTLLYIGKTVDVKARLYQHFREDNWKKHLTKRVEYAECENRTEMDIYEIYYINTLKPKFNLASINTGVPSFILPELNFYEYTDAFDIQITETASRLETEDNTIINYFLDEDIVIAEDDKIPLVDFEKSVYFENCSVKYYTKTDMNFYQISYNYPLCGYDKLLLKYLLTMVNYINDSYSLVIEKKKVITDLGNLYYENDFRGILIKLLCYGVNYGRLNNMYGSYSLITSIETLEYNEKYEISFSNLIEFRDRFIF